jgi:alpha-D-ribose 1-methylphosphonate 5-triphosphate synthase subunit PhnI
LAIKQAAGDLIEAIFLLRAYRTTLPRFMSTLPVDTGDMQVERRISAIFKDLPGGQMLGATFDYTHRLLDFSLLDESDGAADAMSWQALPQSAAQAAPMPRRFAGRGARQHGARA